MRKRRISRRKFLEGTGTALAAVGVVATRPTIAAQRAGAAASGAARTAIRVTVNGVARQVDVDDRWTLAELLRDHLELTGTKIGCDRGE